MGSEGFFVFASNIFFRVLLCHFCKQFFKLLESSLILQNASLSSRASAWSRRFDASALWRDLVRNLWYSSSLHSRCFARQEQSPLCLCSYPRLDSSLSDFVKHVLQASRSGRDVHQIDPRCLDVGQTQHPRRWSRPPGYFLRCGVSIAFAGQSQGYGKRGSCRWTNASHSQGRQSQQCSC